MSDPIIKCKCEGCGWEGERTTVQLGMHLPCPACGALRVYPANLNEGNVLKAEGL